MNKPNIILYTPDETDFSHNGEYILDSMVYDASVDWSLLDSWELSFNMLTQTPFNIEVKNGHFIKAQTPAFDEPQLFYVYRTERDLHEWRVYAMHIYTQLKFTYLLDTFIQNRNPAEAVEQLVSFGADELLQKFSAITDKPGHIDNSRIVRMNALRAIVDESFGQSIVNRYETEFIANNFELQLLDTVGEDRGVDIRFGRDLLQFVESVDYSDMVGRIVPQGFNGFRIPDEEGGPYVSLDDIDEIEKNFTGNERTYLTESVTYSEVKAAIGEQEFDEDAIPVEDAIEALKLLAREEFTRNKVHEAHVSYEVDFVTLSDYAQTDEQKEQLERLQKIKPGDTIEVISDTGTSVKERVIGYSFDPIRKVYTNLILANRSPELTLQSEAEQALGNATNNLEGLTNRVEELELTSSRHSSRLNVLENATYDGFRYLVNEDEEKHDSTLAGGTDNEITGGHDNVTLAGGVNNKAEQDVTNSSVIGGQNNRMRNNVRNSTILSGDNVSMGYGTNTHHDSILAFGRNIEIGQMNWSGSLVHGINTFEEIQGLAVRFYRQYISEPNERAVILASNRQVPEEGFATVTGILQGLTPDKEKYAVYEINLHFDGATTLIDGSISLKAHKGEIDAWNVTVGSVAGVVMTPLEARGGEDKVQWQARFNIDVFDEYA